MSVELDDWGREMCFTAPPPAPHPTSSDRAFHLLKRQIDDLEQRLAGLEAVVVKGGEAPIGVSLGSAWVQRLVTVVADHWQVSPLALVGRSRIGIVTRPRFVLCWLLREATDYPHTRIAQLVGYLDHTSVVHALNRVNEWREKDEVVQYDTNQLLVIAKRLRAEWLVEVGARSTADAARELADNGEVAS